MSDFLRERMFGVRPVHRTNPQTGQSEWYYLDPRNNSRLADRPEIDVESENSPNPYANEIQQYLYENDEYNYKQLYGDTPPPSIQPVRTGINVDMNNLGNNGTNNGNGATGELNDYQRAMLNVAQAAAKGSYMSSVNDGSDSGATPNNNVQQLQIPAGYEQQITMPSYELQQQLQQPQTSAWDKVKNAANNFAGGTEAFSVGYVTGATLGNFDEGMGTATAAVTFNPNNYAIGRDATRQLQNDLQQQHPIAYGVGEFTGAMMTPMHLTKGENFKQKAFNALTDTLNASAGYAENWDDFGTNLAVNGVANIIGLTAEQLPIFRASARPIVQIGKKIFKQGINSSADNAKKLFYKKDEDEERYHY